MKRSSCLLGYLAYHLPARHLRAVAEIAQLRLLRELAALRVPERRVAPAVFAPVLAGDEVALLVGLHLAASDAGDDGSARHAHRPLAERVDADAGGRRADDVLFPQQEAAHADELRVYSRSGPRYVGVEIFVPVEIELEGPYPQHYYDEHAEPVGYAEGSVFFLRDVLPYHYYITCADRLRRARRPRRGCRRRATRPPRDAAPR